jgi:hypothetical protein
MAAATITNLQHTTTTTTEHANKILSVAKVGKGCVKSFQEIKNKIMLV